MSLITQAGPSSRMSGREVCQPDQALWSEKRQEVGTVLKEIREKWGEYDVVRELELVSDWVIMLQISEVTNAMGTQLFCKGGAAGCPVWKATLSARAGSWVKWISRHQRNSSGDAQPVAGVGELSTRTSSSL